MLAAALEEEVAAYAAERDENGRRLVVRTGHAWPRQVTVRRAQSAACPSSCSGGSGQGPLSVTCWCQAGHVHVNVRRPVSGW